MASTPLSQDEDPFHDRSEIEANTPLQGAHTGALTIRAGDAVLTIGGDGVLLEGGESIAAAKESCCGLLGKKSRTQTIPFYNILWTCVVDKGLRITHACNRSPTVVYPETLTFPIETTDLAIVEDWTNTLLTRAYGRSQQKKRIKVLINPFGGKGNADKRWTKHIEPILAAAHCSYEVGHTKYRGHAVDIAEKIDVEAWDVIASCSGDGLPYEVFNGLGKRPDASRALEKVAVVQLPCGTGNAMSLNLNGTDSPSLAALAIVKGIRTPMDLISITQSDRRTLSFLSQSVGIIAESDLGTDHLRWMGSARFTVGFLTRLLGKTIWPCEIAVGVEIEGRPEIREAYKRQAERSSASDDDQRAKNDSLTLPPLRYGTINDPLPSTWHMVPYDKLGNFYCGNMAYMSPDTNFFPAALPSDGCMDLVCIDGDMSRFEALMSLTKVENGGLFDMHYVNYRKVSGYRIIPKGSTKSAEGEGAEDGYISIDGERVPYEPFQAEVHRGLGTVLSRSGKLYEAKGVA